MLNATHSSNPFIVAPVAGHAPLLKRLLAWGSLMRQRRALARLDARLLDDIGVSQNAAKSEAQRPFWDAPRHWGI